jgi:SAM-dependent methyltransferase
MARTPLRTDDFSTQPTAQAGLGSGTKPGILRRFKQGLRRLATPPDTNYLYRRIDPSPYALIPRNAVIFDIGSKGERGRYAFGVPPEDAEIVCVDIVPGPHVDLVADAHDMHMVAENSVDCVLSVSVLEHVRYPHKVVAEIRRILKPGGIVYLNIPFVFAFHGDPDDFYRFSCNGIRILCEDFEEIDSGFNRGPASTMCDLLVRFCAIAFSFNSDRLYALNRIVFGWLLFWIKYLDAIIGHYKTARVIHAGSYFLGKKPAA